MAPVQWNIVDYCMLDMLVASSMHGCFSHYLFTGRIWFFSGNIGKNSCPYVIAVPSIFFLLSLPYSEIKVGKNDRTEHQQCLIVLHAGCHLQKNHIPTVTTQKNRHLDLCFALLGQGEPSTRKSVLFISISYLISRTCNTFCTVAWQSLVLDKLFEY